MFDIQGSCLICHLQDDFEARLKVELSGYQVSRIELTSAPLPEQRQRVWWLGSSDKNSLSAEHWQQRVERLEKVATTLPRYHLAPLLERRKAAEATERPSRSTSEFGYKDEAAYCKAFSEGMQKAISAKRLEADIVPPPRGKRPSAYMPALKLESPLCQATADVYYLILQAKLASLDQSVPGDLTLLADVGVSPSRGQVSFSGAWGALTTSSRLFDFRSQVFLKPEDHMAILGWGGKARLTALKEKEK